MAKQKVRSDMILRHLQKRHVGRKQMDDVFLTEVKNGQSFVPKGQLLILDALAIKKSWANPCFTGYEIKVDRGDFMRDQKWPGYLPYCHQFYFACPKDLIHPEELPKEVGLIYYNRDKDCISTKRKALYRPIEISNEMLMYIIMAKLDSDRHPFFSSKREYFEAWVENKADNKELGYRIGKKMAQLLEDTTKENKTLSRQVAEMESDFTLSKEIQKILLKHGFSVHRWDRHKLPEQLDRVLGAGANPQIINRIRDLVDVANQLDLLIKHQKKNQAG